MSLRQNNPISNIRFAWQFYYTTFIIICKPLKYKINLRIYENLLFRRNNRNFVFLIDKIRVLCYTI